MREITHQQMKAEGKVIVGEFGFGTQRSSGHIICKPEDRQAVNAAYDSIQEGDLSESVLDDVIAAGGKPQKSASTTS
jgi:hypothetical protein